MQASTTRFDLYLAKVTLAVVWETDGREATLEAVAVIQVARVEGSD